MPVVPEMIGGSADLTHSNNTIIKAMKPVTAGDYGGRYIYYGVREHGMAAAMNGIALHGGFVPYGGTFLVFTDYCRPSIRLAALMGLHVIYVMTHDSIGLGEDGPTHQPIEHLAALRAIPNLSLYRPADAVETAECWAAALENPRQPAVIALTRQGVPALRTAHDAINLAARGAYLLLTPERGRDATLIATGSEVQIALAAQKLLAADGIAAAVVSMPSWDRFEAQPISYREEVLGPKDRVRVAVEAASPFGWERYIGREGGIRRHERVRGLRSGRGALQTLQHHRRSGGRRRQGAAMRRGLRSLGDHNLDPSPQPSPRFAGRGGRRRFVPLSRPSGRERSGKGGARSSDLEED